MVSPVDVANMALDNIGARFSITSLTPPYPPPNAIVVARHYQPKIDALHRAAHWNCTRSQASLTLLKAACGTPENPSGSTLPIPPQPWAYEYAYPADCLKVRFLFTNPRANNANVSGLPIFPAGVTVTPLWTADAAQKFVVAIDTDAEGNQIKVILTDCEFAIGVYTARIVNPDLWDPHFLAAAAATLGAWLVTPLKNNAETLKAQIEIATAIITQARISDGNEGVTSTDHEPDWMAVRGFTGFAAGGSARAWYGWDGMGFPGGVFV
jgi:hypothetical protein